ncbi:MAG TPA: hypothetical protein VFH99_01605 [Candidatus Saccharimonadales bacterium]|nr:hypothetical protein [Candidatus Saccharimonadales bacterium]
MTAETLGRESNLSEVREALERDIEHHTGIAHQAYEATLIPGNTMTSIVYHPEARGEWHVDKDDPDFAYKLVVGTAPGWRHTTLLERFRSLEEPIAYLVHEDDYNTVIFRNGDVELEAHSGIVEPHAFNHAGIPSGAIESSRDTGPKTLEKIERAVEIVHTGETEKWENERRLAAIAGGFDGGL